MKVNHHLAYSSQIPRTLPVLLVLVLLAPYNTSADTESGIVIQLCTDDSAEVYARFSKAMNKQLTFSKVPDEPNCSIPPSLPKSKHLVIGRFVAVDNEAVSLSLRLAGSDAKRSREIPWLNTERLPLQTTLQEKRLASLAILVDNLVLEFHNLKFESAPSVQVEKEETEEPRPKEELPDTDASATPDKNTKLSHWIGVFAGVDYLTPGMVAPLIGLGYDLYIERFGIALQLAYEFDSTYNLEGRGFTTSAVLAKLGAKYLFFLRSAGFIGVELDCILRYNMFQRDNIPNAKTRDWSSFGVGVLAHGRLRLAGAFGVFLKPGIELYPFARELEIPDGPSEKVGVFGISVTAGLDLYF
ncbi:MAG: hypothetical protein GY854_23800 [Deltaproteobacteria bacterium]|nr:hypothetical protein [Deltaproteobacteria bacterium]